MVCRSLDRAVLGVAQLEPILRLLALAVPVKALAITPPAMLSRELALHRVGAADIAAAAAGSAAGIGAAPAGAGRGPWCTRCHHRPRPQRVVAGSEPGPRPNFAFRTVAPLLRFSVSVFATDCLAYFSRNLDNILVGRVLGVAALPVWIAYRILVIPVQLLIGQTSTGSCFPVFPRGRQPGEGGRKPGVRDAAAGDLRGPANGICGMRRPGARGPRPGPRVAARGRAGQRARHRGRPQTVFYITPSLMKGLGQERVDREVRGPGRRRTGGRNSDRTPVRRVGRRRRILRCRLHPHARSPADPVAADGSDGDVPAGGHLPSRPRCSLGRRPGTGRCPWPACRDRRTCSGGSRSLPP